MGSADQASDAGQTTAVRVRSAFQRSFAPGELVFEEGGEGAHLYVIQSGCVELTRAERGGSRVVARLGPGEFFGDLAVVTGRPYETRAVAASEVSLLELDRATLEALCFEQPAISIRLIRELAGRLVEAEDRLAALGSSDLLRPVVRALVRQARPATEAGVLIPVTLRSLAADAGLSPLETHRVLHQLFDRKLLELVDEGLIARDLDSLCACLD